MRHRLGRHPDGLPERQRHRDRIDAADGERRAVESGRAIGGQDLHDQILPSWCYEPCLASGWNRITAKAPSAANAARTASCTSTNGGSDCVGASGCKNGSF